MQKTTTTYKTTENTNKLQLTTYRNNERSTYTKTNCNKLQKMAGKNTNKLHKLKKKHKTIQKKALQKQLNTYIYNEKLERKNK